MSALDQGGDHRPAAHARDIGNHRIELDVGIFHRLLQPLDMAGPFSHQLLAGAQQAALLLRLGVRDEAAPNETVGQKVSQPSGVVDVGLAARHGLHVASVNSKSPSLKMCQTGFQ